MAMAMAVVSFPSLLPKATLSSSSLFTPTFLPKKSSSLVTKSFPKTKRSLVVSMSMEAGIGVMGSKLGMMSYFEADGTVVPVTVVGFREGNIVTQIKTLATDGYDAVQVGYRRIRDKKLTKPEIGHLQKAGVIPLEASPGISDCKPSTGSKPTRSLSWTRFSKKEISSMSLVQQSEKGFREESNGTTSKEVR